jgi:hypothetical protein
VDMKPPPHSSLPGRALSLIVVHHPPPPLATGAQLSSLSLQKGYWRATPESESFMACPDSSGCLGGSDPSAQCQAGTTGPLCMVCQAGWSRSWSVWMMGMVVMVVVVVVVVVVMITRR